MHTCTSILSTCLYLVVLIALYEPVRLDHWDGVFHGLLIIVTSWDLCQQMGCFTCNLLTPWCTQLLNQGFEFRNHRFRLLEDAKWNHDARQIFHLMRAHRHLVRFKAACCCLDDDVELVFMINIQSRELNKVGLCRNVLFWWCMDDDDDESKREGGSCRWYCYYLCQFCVIFVYVKGS